MENTNKTVTLSNHEIRIIRRALAKVMHENYEIMETTNPDEMLYKMLVDDNKELQTLKSMLYQALHEYVL